MTRNAENTRTRIVGRANFSVSLPAHIRDMLNMTERLDVVHDRGTLIKTQHGRKVRRLNPRISAFALERFNQAGLLAANVGASAAVHINFAAVARTQNIRPDQISRPRFGDGFF